MTTVFVYGTLKRGERNHPLLEDAKYIGPHVMHAKVKMFCVGFPVLVRDSKVASIWGELYEVNKETLARLDQLESNGRMYKRMRKRIGSRHNRFWVYIGMDSFWNHERDREYVDAGPQGVTIW